MIVMTTMMKYDVLKHMLALYVTKSLRLKIGNLTNALFSALYQISRETNEGGTDMRVFK